MTTNLREAQLRGKRSEFIKEHEADPEGDLDKLNRAISWPSQGSAKATRPAPSQGPSDD